MNDVTVKLKTINVDLSKIDNGDENVYIQNGFDNRQDYLNNLAEEYGNAVYVVADLLGPSEDFDGLVTMLEDFTGEIE